MISLLVFSCAPKQPDVMEDKTTDAEQGMPEAGAKAVSDAEVEMDLKKLSLTDLDNLIKVGEADKDKPLVQQAYNNPDWLTIAYKVKSEKLTEQSSSSSSSTTNHAPIFKDFSNKNGVEGEELKFTISATDEDGDALTYDVKDDPSGVDLSKAGKFSWKPGFDKAGNHEMTFVVSDGKTTATKTITVTIINTNRLPQFTEKWELISKMDVTINEKEVFFLEATDADGDVLQYGVKDLPMNIMVKIDQITGQVTLETNTVEPIGYLLTFTVTDNLATVEKVITVMAFPTACTMNTECPVGYLCGESTNRCELWDLTNLHSPICQKGMNTTAAQEDCVNQGFAYWTDDTLKHNLCYKVIPSLVLNSCTITKPMNNKYKYDCSYTATCDFSSLT